MKSSFITRIATVTGFVFGAFALAAVAGTWTPAPASPPNSNADAPVNIGGGAQTKTGSLTLNSSLADSIGLILGGKIKIVDGTQAAGRVLTSDANGLGTWQDVSVSSSQVIKSGAATLACANYGTPGSVAVTFSPAFTSVPNVTITPNWANYSGDEAPSWWITNLTASGFTINVHTTSGGTCIGNLGATGRVHWIAVGN